MSDPYAMWRYRDVYAPSLTDSNLHFQNRYDTTTIPSQFLGNVEAAALKAEINLESAFRLTGGTGPDQTGHPVMLNVKFDFQDLGAVNQTTGSGVIASNDSANGEFMRYEPLKLALTAAANQLSGNAYQAAEVAA